MTFSAGSQMRLIDLTGETFGRLLVLKRLGTESGHNKWRCRCECGQTIEAIGCNLRSGHTKSCGCWNLEVLRTRSVTHGHARKGARSRTYESWAAMIARCTNPNYPDWQHYGGRGVSVCERWKQFEHFLDDMGERPPNKTIDRWPDKDGSYEPDNCRWATSSEQNRNRRPFKRDRRNARA
jgi:hypothetical protein